MSKGLGQVQRSVLAVFEAAPNELLDSIEIAGRALGKYEIDDSEASSYRRALRKLAEAGAIVDMGRNWHDGRRHYALPKEAERYERRVRETFGAKKVD